MTKRKIAVIGVGKIAQDQHLPVIEKSSYFELAATVSTRGVQHRDLPVYGTATELYAAHPEIELVSVCTPPEVRCELAREAVGAGKDVLLEKPPAPTLSEFSDLVAYAKTRGRLLFQTWHSQYNQAVDDTRALLASEGVESLHIDWNESVRKWHAGQEWVWEPGGFGVFDPGINALSILAKIMPFPLWVREATVRTPENRQTPVAADVVFASAQAHAPKLSGHFDWLSDDDRWTFSIRTRKGTDISLENGGMRLRINGELHLEGASEEYERIYERFAQLLERRESMVGDTPLRWVADIMMVGRRETVAAFEW
jgi:D-galactose 1-dehydrogenase